MAVISKIGAEANKSITCTVRSISKKSQLKVENPVVKHMKSGTEVLCQPGVKTVIPGSETKLGKMGVSAITCYEKGYFPHSDKLVAINFNNSKSGVGLFSPSGAKAFLRQVKELQQELAKSSAEGKSSFILTKSTSKRKKFMV